MFLIGGEKKKKKKNTVPHSIPKILHLMGLQLSGDGDSTVQDQSCNWKRLVNDRLESMFCLGREWEVMMPAEYVRGTKQALQSVSNYHIRNMQLPPIIHRFHRLYIKDSCFHASSVCIKFY